MNKKIKFAIIGCGRTGNRHAELLFTDILDDILTYNSKY